MDKLAEILEFFFYPLFSWLDHSGLTGNLRLTPLYKMAAAIMAVIIVAYVISLLFKPVNKDVSKLKGIRYLGRLVILISAIIMTYNIFKSTSFIVERGRRTSETVGSNFGFILILALIIFLEIRLYKKNR